MRITLFRVLVAIVIALLLASAAVILSNAGAATPRDETPVDAVH